MLRKDWSRTVRPPLVGCLKFIFEKTATGTSIKVVSAQRISFPKLAPMTAAYRLVTETATQSGSVRFVIDFILLGKNRSEATMSVVGPEQAKADQLAAGKRLARIVAGRMKS
jgi:hypothetical protein